MAKIVGIDFGTTNVRIAQRDDDGVTVSRAIGRGLSQDGTEWVPNDVEWMPAVIAFEKQPNGDVKTVVGEAANDLSNNPNAIVIRNVKRLATASDKNLREVIEWHFERRETSWSESFDVENRSIRVWDETVSSEEAVKLILKEAITRAKLAGEAAEWRAGCPVSCDVSYRKALIAALDELGCVGKVEWVTEEPLLLLALGKGIGSRALGEGEARDGLYMVYDLGGGSFDCAVAEIKGDDLTVYANEGMPQGGADIDRLLAQAGASDWNDERLDKILKDDGFITETIRAMLNAYRKTNSLLKIPEDGIGAYVPDGNWSKEFDSMVDGINKILVVGGPTASPHFLENLKEALGEAGADKIVTADDLVVLSDGTTDINNAAITALSHGACYMRGNRYIPLSVDRIPATITLTVSDGRESEQHAYEAFSRLPYRNPNAPYEGDWVELESNKAKTYRIVVESADGDVLYDSEESPMRMPRDGYLGPLADRAKLVIDRFGSVWVRLAAGPSDVPQPLVDNVVILRNPIWQTDLQKEVMEKLEAIQRQREEDAKAAMLKNLNPKAWQVS